MNAANRRLGNVLQRGVDILADLDLDEQDWKGAVVNWVGEALAALDSEEAQGRR